MWSAWRLLYVFVSDENTVHPGVFLSQGLSLAYLCKPHDKSASADSFSSIIAKMWMLKKKWRKIKEQKQNTWIGEAAKSNVIQLFLKDFETNWRVIVSIFIFFCLIVNLKTCTIFWLY